MASQIPGGGGYVKLNSKGIIELLKSSGVEAELRKRMGVVQGAVAGSEIESRQGPRRVSVRVKHGNVYQEAKTGNLSRALDMAGGIRGRSKRGK